MAVFDFFTSRNNSLIEASTYVGHEGRLFYDSANGVVKLSDGVTPGGLPIPYTIATDTIVGGIKAGPGVTINSEGQILIDSAGLEFTFGDFEGTVGTYTDSTNYALLQSLNTDEDVVIASNGDGSVKVVGEFRAYASDTTVTAALEDAQPIFRVLADGQVRMLVPKADSTAGAFEIIGNNTGTFHPPNQTGVIIHATGNSGLPARNYLDANNNYPIIVGRRYNGAVGNLTQVLSGETIFRIAGQAATSSGDFETFGPAKINWIATEDQTPTAQGGKITIDVTANGTNAFGNVITVAEFTSGGVVSNVGFVGNVTLGPNHTLDVTGATVTGLTLGGLDPADIAGTMTGTVIKSTVTGSSLTQVGTLGNLTVSGNIAAGNVSSTNGTFTTFTGKYIRDVRDVGVIADGGTVTIDFATDSIVKCEWDNNFTLAYSNYRPGSVVKFIAYKRAGTGTDNFSLDGITAGHVSSGTTTIAGVAGVANFVEFTCIGTAITDVYAKV